MQKIIKITEQQYNHYINEGVDYSKNDDGSINMTINQDKTDKANTGNNSVDTRVFGNKNEILYGDNTANKHAKSLNQLNTDKQATIKFYQSVINFVKNGRKGKIITDNVPNATVTSVNKWFENGYSDNRIINDAQKAINRNNSDVIFNKYQRVSQSHDDNNIARYNVGVVPSTDIKYIALFTMTDFNFSDAIKHGTLRQNGSTDKLLGINSDEREKGGEGRSNSYKTLDVTYDGSTKPNIAQNFSLNDVQNGHYKQSYALKTQTQNNGYTSINQFLDKSVMYASYALKKENYMPDYIIAAPSSSKFNDYYCTNFSRKLGIEYVKDFFQRNIINVKFDKDKDTQEMLKQGISPKDILQFEMQVKNAAYKEIAYFVSQPLRDFFNQNQTLFSNISLKKNSRDKTPIRDVFDCCMNYAYKTIINQYVNHDFIGDNLVKNFMSTQNKLQKSYDSEHILSEINSRIKLKIGMKKFNNVLLQIKDLVEQYINQIKSNGYKLQFNSKRFKVTQIPKLCRPYLHNVYIVADKAMNNGNLLNRYKNAKFLIFDEDINSGATLKCAIDALQDKLPESNQNNIICLVNAYSASGF